MTVAIQAWATENAAWRAAVPRLSVLIPFFRDEPAPLLRALNVPRALEPPFGPAPRGEVAR